MAIYYAYMFLLFIIIVNDITLNYNMSSYYTIVCKLYQIQSQSPIFKQFPGGHSLRPPAALCPACLVVFAHNCSHPPMGPMYVAC